MKWTAVNSCPNGRASHNPCCVLLFSCCFFFHHARPDAPHTSHTHTHTNKFNDSFLLLNGFNTSIVSIFVRAWAHKTASPFIHLSFSLRPLLAFVALGVFGCFSSAASDKVSESKSTANWPRRDHPTQSDKPDYGNSRKISLRGFISLSPFSTEQNCTLFSLSIFLKNKNSIFLFFLDSFKRKANS